MEKVLFAALEKALACAEVEEKVSLVQVLADDWRQGRLRHDIDYPLQTPTQRGYPTRPEIVHATKVPKRKLNSPEGLAVLFHAVAHIEWSAIDLALDHAYRFRGLPSEYYADWIGVAAEEAGHFLLLREHLRTYSHDYGDFPAHDVLWSLNLSTADDLLARMALVPRLAEARGLDATPPIQAKLAQAGDVAGAQVLEIILNDEIGHVGLGDKWFRRFCAEQGLPVEATYLHFMNKFDVPLPTPPMNEKARLAAGFTAAELVGLNAVKPTHA
jgi:uncharacterized ferritin-like protein (DUF455 family)